MGDNRNSRRMRRLNYFDAKSRLPDTLREARGRRQIQREPNKFPLSGISLNFLQGYFPFERFTTMGELEGSIIKLTKEDKCSFVELLASSGEQEFQDAVRPKAQFFVSFAYRTKWADLLASLLNYQEQHGLSDMYLWLSVFSVNQHEANHFEKEWFRNAFSKAITEIGHTLFIMSPWPESIALKRLWCIFELYITLSGDTCKLDIVLNKEDELELMEKLEQDKEASCYTTVQVEHAKASRPEDEKELRKFIMSLSYETVNRAISTRLEQWIGSTFNTALSAAQELEGKDEKERELRMTLELNRRMSKYLVDTGKPRLAEAHSRKTLTRCEKLHGKVHPSTAQAHDAIAYVYQKEGDHSKAFEQLERAAKVRLQCVEKHHLDQAEVAEPLYTHVKLLMEQLKPSQAQDLIELYNTGLVEPSKQEATYRLRVQSVQVLFLHETAQLEKLSGAMPECDELAKTVSTQGVGKVPYEYALCLAHQAELEKERSLPQRVEQSLRMSIRFSRPYDCAGDLAERLFSFAEILLVNEKLDEARDAFEEAEEWNASLDESEKRLSLEKLLDFRMRLLRKGTRPMPVAQAAPRVRRRPLSVKREKKSVRNARIAIRSKKKSGNKGTKRGDSVISL